MALDSTWGGSASNSYISATGAHSFLLTFVYDTTAWTDSTTLQREAALAEATVTIDQFQYISNRFYPDQRLAFPRSYPGLSVWPQDNGNSTSDSVFQANMKDIVERACAYQALHICRLGGIDSDLENQARGLTSYSEEVGPVRESASYSGNSSSRGGFINPAARMNPQALGLLGPYRTTKKILRG